MPGDARPDLILPEMLKVYIHEKCSTCRRALDWLADRAIPHVVLSIRESPPPPEVLAAALRATGKPITSIANTSGMDYRALGLKEILPTMPLDQALALLSSNGMLIRRPFAHDPANQIHLSGFSEKSWTTTLHPPA